MSGSPAALGRILHHPVPEPLLTGPGQAWAVLEHPTAGPWVLDGDRRILRLGAYQGEVSDQEIPQTRQVLDARADQDPVRGSGRRAVSVPADVQRVPRENLATLSDVWLTVPDAGPRRSTATARAASMVGAVSSRAAKANPMSTARVKCPGRLLSSWSAMARIRSCHHGGSDSGQAAFLLYWRPLCQESAHRTAMTTMLLRHPGYRLDGTGSQHESECDGDPTEQPERHDVADEVRYFAVPPRLRPRRAAYLLVRRCCSMRVDRLSA